MLLTYEGYGVSSARQQVIHDQREDGIAEDEGHLESGPVHTMWKAAEEQDVYHILSGPAPQSELWKEKKR